MGYDRLSLLKLMYLSREGDRREGILLRQGKGWFQIASMGHETMAVIPKLMQPDDYLFPYYRDRAMVMARGVSNAELANAFFAKIRSSSGGRQLPGHFSDRKRHIWSVPSPTGANTLPACGVAWAMKMDGKPNLVIATIGDAASREGEFYEAVAFAIERQLPIIFIVEDNNYGVSTNTDGFNPFKLKVFNESYIIHVDARHPDRLFDAMNPVVNKTRSGGGPIVVVAEVDRLCPHTNGDDHHVYRSKSDIEAMHQRDPITVVSQELIDAGILKEDEWEKIKQEISKIVGREYRLAERGKNPTSDDLLTQVFSPTVPSVQVPVERPSRWRMVDAINAVFKHALSSSERFIFFGEDIEAPKGGVFGLTADLSRNHADQVFNSPLAEATIVGVGVGLACYGKRPILEIQFIDFVSPAMNQLTQNLATLRWRTNGEWNCPVVIYAPYGAYLPGGAIWHSQANESIFAHFPGIQVVVPSTPEDAAALMWTAMSSEDATLFLIPKHLLRQRMDSLENIPPVRIGEARIRRAGTDVTVVAWGNCIELTLAAADALAEEISVEVIDLRSIQPWDKNTVRESLEITGRLVVVQEDGRSCSVGQMIISEIMVDPESFCYFVSTPHLVSKPDVHIGFNPIYEYSALPDLDQVVHAIKRTMED